MGKTYTILETLKRMDAKHALVVCPAIVKTHWHRSAEEIGFEGRLTVESYEKVTRGGLQMMANLTIKEKIDTLVADEAHYCKHPTSQRTKLIMGRDGYARRVGRAILASGTPMPKNPAELFTQLVFLAPDVMRAFGVETYQKWMDTFCVVVVRWARGQRIEKVVGVRNPDVLRLLLNEIMLRREHGIDLPPLWWQTIRLDGDDLWADDDDIEPMVNAAIAAGNLASIAMDPHVARMRRRLGELKILPVVEMLSSQLADSTEKIAVWAYHTSVLHGLRDGLEQFGVAFIDGSTSASKRDSALIAFQNDPRTRVFIGQNTATGTGFDGLQHAASRGILVEPDWTAKNNVQLGHRLARMGQKAPTTIMQMVILAGTLDEAIVGQNLMETKMEEKVFGG